MAVIHPCNNCGEPSTHRCTFHLHPDDIADGVWMYHCRKHLCLHCEDIPEEE